MAFSPDDNIVFFQVRNKRRFNFIEFFGFQYSKIRQFFYILYLRTPVKSLPRENSVMTITPFSITLQPNVSVELSNLITSTCYLK